VQAIQKNTSETVCSECRCNSIAVAPHVAEYIPSGKTAAHQAL
jgi:predicted class III extradiol MEMO1 family dioxygenase